MSDRHGEDIVGATHASPKTPVAGRKEVRLMRAVYTQAGYYFVTACTSQRKLLFGRVDGDTALASSLGGVVITALNGVNDHFESWGLDCYVVMPNHLHAVVICRLGTDKAVAESGPERSSLASVVGSVKSADTREARRAGLFGADPLWQRGFH
ncbi:MAG: hypothetical protein M3R04_01060 [bacterium]|nr:hypothetical protein [bacterium]